MLTINEIASAIDSHIRTGLKGVSNFSYSIEMLEREVTIERNRILESVHKKPGFEIAPFYQTVNGLKADWGSISKLPVSLQTTTEEQVLHFQLPSPLTTMKDRSVGYIGSPLRDSDGWKAYFDDSYKKHMYKRYTSHRPFVYIHPVPDVSNGLYDAYVLNYSGNLKLISMDYVMENPEDIYDFMLTDESMKFPAPEWCVEEIIRRLTLKYMAQYRQYHAPTQPNNQTDNVA